ncbi:uncharacterized protein LOC144582228 [Callithrix jacchus]
MLRASAGLCRGFKRNKEAMAAVPAVRTWLGMRKPVADQLQEGSGGLQSLGAARTAGGSGRPWVWRPAYSLDTWPFKAQASNPSGALSRLRLLSLLGFWDLCDSSHQAFPPSGSEHPPQGSGSLGGGEWGGE